MSRLALALLCTSLLPTAGCGDKDDDTGSATAAEADADTDADADADSDSDADADTDTDTEPAGDKEPGTPACTVTFSSGDWSTGSGYWSAATNSTLQADDPDSELELQLEFDGNLRDDDSLGVTRMVWVDTVHNGYDFYYQAKPDGVTFEVEGRDADGDYIWGAVEGTFTLTDSEGGADIELEALSCESWPKFGT